MNNIMKLTAAALGAMSIAGGVAVAQGTSTNPDDGRAQTANYGTPPGAPLKRDGSLSADPAATAPAAAAAMETSRTATTTSRTTNWNNPPSAASTRPAADTSADTNSAYAAPRPRADRN